MRYFLTTVALAATIAVAGNVVAQTTEENGNSNFNTWGSFWSSMNDDVGILGLDNSYPNPMEWGMAINLNHGTRQNIENLYFVNFVDQVRTGGKTDVANFWATTDSIGKIGNVFDGADLGGETIANFNLQVGNRNLGIIAGAERNFGVSTDDVLASDIELTNNSVKYGETTIGNGTWGISDTGDTQFNVRNDGIISSVNMDGGSLVNNNRVEELTYYSGNYTAGENGTIGKLLVGSTDNLSNIIGPVESAALAAGGNGIITITGTGDFDNISYSHDFADVTNSIDLTDFNVKLDIEAFNSFTDFEADFANLVGAGNEFSFDFANVFGVGIENFNVSGVDGLETFGFLWGIDDEFFSILSPDGELFAGWKYTTNGTGIAYTAPPADGVAAPEPATLAVLGLGLAGLGMASRRRRK